VPNIKATPFFIAAAILFTSLVCPRFAEAQKAGGASLAGRVSSQEEGPMEGVLVSARKDGSNVTVTVASDAHGRYSFPRNRLNPGEYSLSIRAAGYEMDAVKASVTSQKVVATDLQLHKTQDLPAQLTTAEWLMSAPGTHEQNNVLLGCVICHTVERIFRSHHTADEFAQVRQRMGTYYEGTLPERPQLNPPRPAPAPGAPAVPSRFTPAELQYMSTINLSSVSQWQYPLKTLPRPKGKATRMIVTQYDMPRKYTMPHDVVVGAGGVVWYCDHAQQLLGRLDSKTGTVVEYPVPLLKPGIPTGIHFLELDPDGNPWLSMGAQGGVARFDRKTQTFQTWTMPASKADGDIYPNAYDLLLGYLTPDGKVWVGEPVAGKIQRLDTQTGEWDSEVIRPYRDVPKDSPLASLSHLFYDIYADSQKNVYLTDISSGYIEKIDAKTLKTSAYQTPTPDSGPRRAHMDQQDRLWFGEYSGNKIGMFDTKTEQFHEWEVPSPFSGPYDAVLDKNGYVWTGGMTTDRVTRLNPKTGEMVEYLLPRRTNIRRVEVDNSANPIAFWVGDDHGSSILKLEPLE
jgi:virginiamycin B lyase